MSTQINLNACKIILNNETKPSKYNDININYINS